MVEKIALAIIGGSGLYKMSGMTDTQEMDISTPFGKPSAPIIVGTIAGQRIAFLARHGIGHHIMPSEVPFRANIYALKAIGAERVVSINACGSLRQDYAPGDIVIPDQLFDLTHSRPRTFFGEGLVAHVGVANPFCPQMSTEMESAVRTTGANVHRGGSFVIIEGPRFSTRTESNVYRTWGMSLVGMTAAPEAFLAREAELCYVVMAHVTDYDVWHINEQPVTVEMVVKTLNQNTKIAQAALLNLINRLPESHDCSCGTALSKAIITSQEVIPSETRLKLDLLVGKYLS